MKQVLIISASPRKNGNSEILCDRFANGALESGCKVEKVFLASKNIGYCRGCGVCNSTHQCVQRDDMGEILDKMVSADVIVLATPVYFYSMDGQMKTFIDRTVPRYTEIRNKGFYSREQRAKATHAWPWRLPRGSNTPPLAARYLTLL